MGVEYLRNEAKAVVRWQRGRHSDRDDLRLKERTVCLCPLMPAGESFCLAWESVHQCEDIVGGDDRVAYEQSHSASLVLDHVLRFGRWEKKVVGEPFNGRPKSR